MGILLKLSAAALLASSVCLVLKKNSPEMGLMLAVLVCVGGFALIAEILLPILELIRDAGKLGGISSTLFYPLLKCLGIGIGAKLSADICKDSGQTAIAGSVELAGAVCAVYCSLPLLNALMDMLEELV